MSGWGELGGGYLLKEMTFRMRKEDIPDRRNSWEKAPGVGRSKVYQRTVRGRIQGKEWLRI